MSDEQHDSVWPPPGLDFSKPTIARAYDALLGGKDNFEADRALADYACKHIRAQRIGYRKPESPGPRSEVPRR